MPTGTKFSNAVCGFLTTDASCVHTCMPGFTDNNVDTPGAGQAYFCPGGKFVGTLLKCEPNECASNHVPGVGVNPGVGVDLSTDLKCVAAADAADAADEAECAEHATESACTAVNTCTAKDGAADADEDACKVLSTDPTADTTCTANAKCKTVAKCRLDVPCSFLKTDQSCTQHCRHGYRDNNEGKGQRYTCPSGVFTGTKLHCTPEPCSASYTAKGAPSGTLPDTVPRSPGLANKMSESCDGLVTDGPPCTHICAKGYIDNSNVPPSACVEKDTCSPNDGTIFNAADESECSLIASAAECIANQICVAAEITNAADEAECKQLSDDGCTANPKCRTTAKCMVNAKTVLQEEACKAYQYEATCIQDTKCSWAVGQPTLPGIGQTYTCDGGTFFGTPLVCLPADCMAGLPSGLGYSSITPRTLLSFQKDDALSVSRVVDSHWLEGELTDPAVHQARNDGPAQSIGNNGVFPANFVQVSIAYVRMCTESVFQEDCEGRQPGTVETSLSTNISCRWATGGDGDGGKCVADVAALYTHDAGARAVSKLITDGPPVHQTCTVGYTGNDVEQSGQEYTCPNAVLTGTILHCEADDCSEEVVKGTGYGAMCDNLRTNSEECVQECTDGYLNIAELDRQLRRVPTGDSAPAQGTSGMLHYRCAIQIELVACSILCTHHQHPVACKIVESSKKAGFGNSANVGNGADNDTSEEQMATAKILPDHDLHWRWIRLYRCKILKDVASCGILCSTHNDAEACLDGGGGENSDVIITDAESLSEAEAEAEAELSVWINTFEGKPGTYSCKDGVFMVTHPNHCIPNVCKTTVPSGPGFSSRCDDMLTGESCQQFCLEGYRDNNNGNGQTYTCTNGKFEFTTLLRCSRENCQPPKKGIGYTANCDNMNSDGQECTQQCEPAYSGTSGLEEVDKVLFKCSEGDVDPSNPVWSRKPVFIADGEASDACLPDGCFKCWPDACSGNVPSGPGLSTNCDDFKTNEYCVQTCSPGYVPNMLTGSMLDGKNVVDDSHNWNRLDGTKLVCEAKDTGSKVDVTACKRLLTDLTLMDNSKADDRKRFCISNERCKTTINIVSSSNAKCVAIDTKVAKDKDACKLLAVGDGSCTSNKRCTATYAVLYPESLVNEKMPHLGFHELFYPVPKSEYTCIGGVFAGIELQCEPADCTHAFTEGLAHKGYSTNCDNFVTDAPACTQYCTDGWIGAQDGVSEQTYTCPAGNFSGTPLVCKPKDCSQTIRSGLGYDDTACPIFVSDNDRCHHNCKSYYYSFPPPSIPSICVRCQYRVCK